MKTEWRAFCVQETDNDKLKVCMTHTADTANLLWNGCKVAIATQRLFEAATVRAAKP